MGLSLESHGLSSKKPMKELKCFHYILTHKVLVPNLRQFLRPQALGEEKGLAMHNA